MALAAEVSFTIDLPAAVAASAAAARAAAPRRLEVRQGDAVRLLVRSARAGEAHLHAYRLHARVEAGGEAQMAFVARASGRFRIEWHEAEEARGAGGGGGKPGAPDAGRGHHGPPLAVLDVLPR